MEILLLLIRLFLSLTFGVAGAAKLADPAGSRKALEGFGVPESLIVPLAWALPIAELLTAVALLPLATAWWGGWAALGLLLVFLAGIGVNLARGSAPDCHCFGQLHSEPVSWTVFARNIVFALLAVFLLWQGRTNPGVSLGTWLGSLSVAESISLAISVLTATLAAAMFVMLRRVMSEQSTLLESVKTLQEIIEEDYAKPEPVERKDVPNLSNGLPVGAPAPAFALPMLDGKTLTLADLLALNKSVLLLFISPQCGPCKNLLPLVRTWQRDYSEQFTVAVLSKGSAEEVQDKLKIYETRYLMLEDGSTVSADYHAQWTPTAVLVNRQGKIASPLSVGFQAIRDYVEQLIDTADQEVPAPVRIGNSLFNIGEPAPRFDLLDMLGNDVAFNERINRETLLMFWNPGCGYCQKMVEELQRWERQADERAPQLIFVTTGTEAEVDALSKEFRSLFLHDEDNDLAPLFGAAGTPSALLLTADWRIASSLAVGEKDIFSLMGWRKAESSVAQNGKAAAVA